MRAPPRLVVVVARKRPVVVEVISTRVGGDAMTRLAPVLAVAMATATVSADVSTTERKRIEEAASVIKEIHAVPDKDIPQELWNKAACVIVVPGLKKAAFVVGGEYGKGLMSCRHNRAWSAP